MKIGVSSYSFIKYLVDGKMDLKDVIKKAKEIGFEAIEFIGFEDEKFSLDFAKEIKEEADKNNIEISAYVIGADLLKENEELSKEISTIKKHIDIAECLGTKLFRYDVVKMLPRLMSFEMALEKVVDSMREIADYAMDKGIMTMIENHGRVFQDGYRMEKIYNRVNHPNFSLLVDVGNFACVDDDSVKCVSRRANLASHVHVKDFIIKPFEIGQKEDDCFVTRGANRLYGTTPGDGDIKSVQCIEILKKSGYDGYIDVEYEGSEDCIIALEKALKYLKTVC